MTEYYSGAAHIMIDGICHVALAGDCKTIYPGQKHQVFNNLTKSPLTILERCEPAWQAADLIPV